MVDPEPLRGIVVSIIPIVGSAKHRLGRQLRDFPFLSPSQIKLRILIIIKVRGCRILKWVAKLGYIRDNRFLVIPTERTVNNGPTSAIDLHLTPHIEGTFLWVGANWVVV
jgi:hypothetical protein